MNRLYSVAIRHTTSHLALRSHAAALVCRVASSSSDTTVTACASLGNLAKLRLMASASLISSCRTRTELRRNWCWSWRLNSETIDLKLAKERRERSQKVRVLTWQDLRSCIRNCPIPYASSLSTKPCTVSGPHDRLWVSKLGSRTTALPRLMTNISVAISPACTIKSLGIKIWCVNFVISARSKTSEHPSKRVKLCSTRRFRAIPTCSEREGGSSCSTFRSSAPLCRSHRYA
mmetsp:Transcript_2887/g.5472  ORF Transcript_2887/g.5472 Transcript_2887/m.5472 type:complete len:232 (+) Transcript_2887:224-919(+)